MSRRELEAANEAHARDRIAAQLRPKLLRRIAGEPTASARLLRALLPTQGANAVTDLTVSAQSTQDQVRTAYRRAMARMHPDRTQHLKSIEDRVEAEEIYKLLNAQYEHLK
jgi:hypothetical protein